VTLTFDLLTTDVDLSSVCTVDHLFEFAAQLVYSFSKYRVHKIGNKKKRTDRRTDERPGKRRYASGQSGPAKA